MLHPYTTHWTIVINYVFKFDIIEFIIELKEGMSMITAPYQYKYWYLLIEKLS